MYMPYYKTSKIKTETRSITGVTCTGKVTEGHMELSNPQSHLGGRGIWKI